MWALFRSCDLGAIRLSLQLCKWVVSSNFSCSADRQYVPKLMGLEIQLVFTRVLSQKIKP